MSTPIQTNTEELQEILQQVYDLPDGSSGGSSEPDLVIGLNWRNTAPNRFPGSVIAEAKYTYEDVSIESGSVAAVVEKLQQGLPVRVTMQEVNFYNRGAWASGQTEASQIYIVHEGAIEYPNTPAVGLACIFNMQSCIYMTSWPSYAPIIVGIGFNISTGEPAWYTEAELSTT